MKGAREEERGGRILIRVNYNPTHGSVFSRDPRVTGSVQLAGAAQPKWSPTNQGSTLLTFGLLWRLLRWEGGNSICLYQYLSEFISLFFIKEQKIEIKTSVSPPTYPALTGFLLKHISPEAPLIAFKVHSSQSNPWIWIHYRLVCCNFRATFSVCILFFS